MTAVEPVELTPEDAENERLRAEALAYMERTKPDEGEDFMEFWAAMNRTATSMRNVFGRDVTLPPQMPLGFEAAAKAVEKSKDPEDTKRMVGILFGQESLDFWTSDGMDVDQFAVLLLWGVANTRKPHSMSLAEAFQHYLSRAEEEAAEQGKAERPSVTTKRPGTRSSSTGAASKRTSRASTASRKSSSPS